MTTEEALKTFQSYSGEEQLEIVRSFWLDIEPYKDIYKGVESNVEIMSELLRAVKADDEDAETYLIKLHEYYNDSSSLIMWFELEAGQIPDSKQYKHLCNYIEAK